MKSESLSSPPRPRLAFRVGVVGHRPDRMQHADLEVLRATVRSILDTIKTAVRRSEQDGEMSRFYAVGESQIFATSPLAEGADRLFAKEALDLGYTLNCITPFAVGEFEKDFVPEQSTTGDSASLQEFRSLLERATAVVQLDGTRTDNGASYGAGGRIVLNQSDLLIAIWDGIRLGKKGGTEETLDEAVSVGVPVVWIDAQAPHSWEMVTERSRLGKKDSDERAIPVAGTLQSLEGLVVDLLRIPQPSTPDTDPHEKQEQPDACPAGYLAEKLPKRSFMVFWKVFRDILGDGKFPRVDVRVTPIESKGEAGTGSVHSSAEGILGLLDRFDAWPSKLADLYANRYRSAFVLTYFLAAFAVAFAVFPMAYHLEGRIWGSVEFAVLIFALVLVWLGLHQHWHRKWLEYRMLAEFIRHLRLVTPLGGGRIFAQVPAHHTVYGQPSSTWMDWYVRAVRRSLPLGSVVVDRKYITYTLDHLHELLRGQIEYHEGNSHRCHAISHRLHVMGLASLGATVVCVGAHLLDRRHLLPSHFLHFVSGFFPALGAAFAGINNQGEFKRIHKRSEAMAAQLKKLLGETEHLRLQIQALPSETTALHSVEVRNLATRVANLLVSEVLDWRVVFTDRPLDPPA